ncbi:MAG: hypothetical protein AAF411_25280 [Myxococcota bacterium]
MSVRVLVFAVLLLVGCGNESTFGDLGGSCRSSTDCDENARCFGARDADSRCSLRCDTGTRLCESGEVCILVAGSEGIPDEHICYLGGDVEVGGRCTDGGECELGAVCILGASGEPGVCRLACEVGDARCGGVECVALDDGPAGFCP